jgi:thioredoxin-like negative regulator of GroEL
MIEATEAGFYEELADASREGGVTVVYFTAPWCGPCRMLKPTLDKLEAANEGLTILRVDVDLCPEIAIDYRIQSVPQLFFYAAGIEFERTQGVQQLKPLQAIIDRYQEDK